MQLNIDSKELEPLIRCIVEEVIARVDRDRDALGDRLAFTEAEAAQIIGLESHQLRDERRRGRINASLIVNRGIRYLRSDLLDYLMRNRANGCAVRPSTKWTEPEMTRGKSVEDLGVRVAATNVKCPLAGDKGVANRAEIKVEQNNARPPPAD